MLVCNNMQLIVDFESFNPKRTYRNQPETEILLFFQVLFQFYRAVARWKWIQWICFVFSLMSIPPVHTSQGPSLQLHFLTPSNLCHVIWLVTFLTTVSQKFSMIMLFPGRFNLVGTIPISFGSQKHYFWIASWQVCLAYMQAGEVDFDRFESGVFEPLTS